MLITFSFCFFLLVFTRFYAFELQKVDDFVRPSSLDTSKKIRVHDISYFNEPVLRSGVKLANRRHVIYHITKDGKEETITPSELRFYKKIWGNNALDFSDNFDLPEKQKYVI